MNENAALLWQLVKQTNYQLQNWEPIRKSCNLEMNNFWILKVSRQMRERHIAMHNFLINFRSFQELFLQFGWFTKQQDIFHSHWNESKVSWVVFCGRALINIRILRVRFWRYNLEPNLQNGLPFTTLLLPKYVWYHSKVVSCSNANNIFNE